MCFPGKYTRAISVVVVLTSVLRWRTFRLNELGRVICLVSALEGHSLLTANERALRRKFHCLKQRYLRCHSFPGKRRRRYLSSLSSDIAVISANSPNCRDNLTLYLTTPHAH